jgi:hypothetical protein
MNPYQEEHKKKFKFCVFSIGQVHHDAVSDETRTIKELKKYSIKELKEEIEYYEIKDFITTKGCGSGKNGNIIKMDLILDIYYHIKENNYYFNLVVYENDILGDNKPILKYMKNKIHNPLLKENTNNWRNRIIE